MNRVFRSIVLLLLTAFCPLAATADQPNEQYKKYVGTWNGTKGIWNGKALTDEQAKQCILTIYPLRELGDLSGGQRGMDLVVPDKVVGFKLASDRDKEKFVYVTEWKQYNWGVDLSAKPSTLLAMKFNGIKAHTFGGVCRLDGDKLTLCVSFGVATFPKQFSSSRDSEVLLLEFKRGK